MSLSERDVRALVVREMSTRARMGHAAMVIAALVVVVAVGSLWLSEPDLPVRTHVAFAAIVATGLAWMTAGVVSLRRRRVLFASHRVAVARGVAGMAVFLTAGAIVSWALGERGVVMQATAACGVVIFAAAAGALVGARRRVSRLAERRRELETERARLADAMGPADPAERPRR